uniref:SRI domain-containing protein n=1 Tax=Globodera pallida TaxID=36090 RepID=A0A183C081_GLOPA
MFRIQAQVQVARRQRPKQQTVEAARRETAPASESHEIKQALCSYIMRYHKEFKETPSKNVNLRDEEKLKQHKGKNNRQKKSSATGHKNRQFERIGKNIKLYKRLPKAPRGPPKHPERDERWRKKRYKNHKADDIGGGGGRPSLRLGQRRGSSYLYVNKKNKMRARTRPREREAKARDQQQQQQQSVEEIVCRSERADDD